MKIGSQWRHLCKKTPCRICHGRMWTLDFINMPLDRVVVWLKLNGTNKIYHIPMNRLLNCYEEVL